jgi:hypothetical protein
MALSKNINSYATVAEADTYFKDRLDVEAWISAESTQKAQALVTATSLIDTLNWTGVAVSETQPLAFPRSGVFFDPRLGMDIEFNDSVPSRIIQATFELAYHLLNNDGLLDDTGSVKDLTVGSINLTRVLSPNKIPFSVKRLIKPLQVNQGANLWWRSN